MFVSHTACVLESLLNLGIIIILLADYDFTRIVLIKIIMSVPT